MASGMTVVTYNGVTIANCNTLKFDQKAQMDPSDNGLVRHTFAIRVSGYWLASLNNRVGIQPIGSEPSAAVQSFEVRPLLMEPRKEFHMRCGADASGVGGKTMLNVVQAGKMSGGRSRDIDVMNGPKPRYCTVTKFISDETFRVEFEVELNVIECLPPPGAEEGEVYTTQNQVIHNRWSSVDEITTDMYTNRTFMGEAIVTTANVNPHNFRAIILPPQQEGMRREQMRFKATEDGLKLQYTFVDREVAFAAPLPATSWRYEHREQLTISDTADVMTASMMIEMRGPRDVDKRDCLRVAGAIIEGKLLLPDILPEDDDAPGDFELIPRAAWINKLVYVDSAGSDQDNAFRIHIEILRTPPNIVDNPEREDEQNDPRLAIAYWMKYQTDAVTKPIDDTRIAGYNSNQSPGTYPRDELAFKGEIPLVKAVSTHLQAQCGNLETRYTNLGVDASDPDPGYIAINESVPLPVRVVPRINDYPEPKYTQEHHENVYRYSIGETEYYESESIGVSGAADELPQEDEYGGSPGEDKYPDDQSSQQELIQSGEAYRLGPGQPTLRLIIESERLGKPPEHKVPFRMYEDETGRKWVRQFHKVQTETKRGPNGERRFRSRLRVTYKGLHTGSTTSFVGVRQTEANEWEVTGETGEGKFFDGFKYMDRLLGYDPPPDDPPPDP